MATKSKAKAEPVEEPVVEVDTPEITPVEVNHGDVMAIYRVVSSGGEGILNVRFADGSEEQYPCDDEKFAAFQADDADWAVKAKKFYGSL
jgi:hypothetical protein